MDLKKAVFLLLVTAYAVAFIYSWIPLLNWGDFDPMSNFMVLLLAAVLPAACLSILAAALFPRGELGRWIVWAVAVIIIILLILVLTGAFIPIWEMTSGLACVSSPINEMEAKIQTAESQLGAQGVTGWVCMKTGEQFTDKALTNHIPNLGDLVFECDAPGCGERGPLRLESKRVEAVANVRFKMQAACQKAGNSTYRCQLIVVETSADKYLNYQISPLIWLFVLIHAMMAGLIIFLWKGRHEKKPTK